MAAALDQVPSLQPFYSPLVTLQVRDCPPVPGVPPCVEQQGGGGVIHGFLRDIGDQPEDTLPLSGEGRAGKGSSGGNKRKQICVKSTSSPTLLDLLSIG